MGEPIWKSAPDAVRFFAENYLGPSQPCAVGWIFSPQAAQWVILDMSTTSGTTAALTSRSLVDVDLATVFEICLFTPEVELLWTYEPGHNLGITAIRHDAAAAERGLRSRPASHQLLWGRVAAVEGKWLRLDDARIGGLWVPLPATQGNLGDYVVLDIVEYESIDAYGNVSLADERHLGLRLVKEDQLEFAKEAVSA